MFKSFKLMSLNGKIILFGVLITSISTFMLSPFLALYMSSKGFSAAEIGIVLTASVISQQGLTFIGGMMGDRFSYRKVMIAGLIIRTIGYITFLFSNALSLLIIASSFAGIGGALLTPSTKASIATEEKLGGKAFALRNVAVNIGAALGPILGGLLYETSFNVVFLTAAFTHLTLLIFVVLFVKNFQKAKSNNMIAEFKNIIRDKNIIYLTIVSSIFWFVYSQLNLSIPLYSKSYLHMESLTSTLFTLNGLIVIIFQFNLMSFFESKYTCVNILVYGMLFLAASFTSIFVVPNIVGLYIFIILFTVGEILVGPSIDNAATYIAPSKSSVGGYLGFVSLGWAIGGSLGNLVGGYLFNLANDRYWIIWVIYSLISIFAAILFKKFIGRSSEMIESKKVTI